MDNKNIELNAQQKAEADRLRKLGYSIKAIAKELHVRDRKVSVYFKGTAKVPPTKGKQHKASAVSKKQTCGKPSRGGNVLDNIVRLCAKQSLYALDKIFKAIGKVAPIPVGVRDLIKRNFVDAVMSIALGTIMGMPSTLKTNWILEAQPDFMTEAEEDILKDTGKARCKKAAKCKAKAKGKK